MEYHYKACTNKGKRAINEDAFYPVQKNKSTNLFVVCDGVGGHGNGDLAAQFVINTLPQKLAQAKKIEQQAVHHAVSQTNTALTGYAEEIGNKNMGTTLAMLHLEKHQAHICWVGDSRVYHLRDGKILYKTVDHSLLEMMRQKGNFLDDERDAKALKHIIYQALGPNRDTFAPSVVCLDDVQIGDIFLLATDGFFEAWEDCDTLLKLATFNDVSFKELRKGCAEKARDNYTFIVVKVSKLNSPE